MPQKTLALSKRDAAVAKRIARLQNRFIAALTKLPSVKHACLTSGIHRGTVYKWRAADEQFAARWQEALDASIDEIEATAFKIALEDGSDANANARVNMIQFLLRCHKPEVYRERIEAAVAGGIILLPQKEQGPE